MLKKREELISEMDTLDYVNFFFPFTWDSTLSEVETKMKDFPNVSCRSASDVLAGDILVCYDTTAPASFNEIYEYDYYFVPENHNKLYMSSFTASFMDETDIKRGFDFMKELYGFENMEPYQSSFTDALLEDTSLFSVVTDNTNVYMLMAGEGSDDYYPYLNIRVLPKILVDNPSRESDTSEKENAAADDTK